jgi:hypothetical protein
MLYAVLDIELEPWHELPHINTRSSLRGIFDNQEEAKKAITKYFNDLDEDLQKQDITFVEENKSLLVFWGANVDEVPDAIIVPKVINTFQ